VIISDAPQAGGEEREERERNPAQSQENQVSQRKTPLFVGGRVGAKDVRVRDESRAADIRES